MFRCTNEFCRWEGETPEQDENEGFPVLICPECDDDVREITADDNATLAQIRAWLESKGIGPNDPRYPRK